MGTNKTIDHEKSINVLRSPPAIFYCGYRGRASASYSVLTFDSLSYSYNNQHNGGLDPETGIFTSPTPGIYSMTWSLTARNEAGDQNVRIYLMKNGARVHESIHFSYYTGASGRVSDEGGRTLIIDLLEGETLSMFCENCSAEVFNVNFCV